MDLIIHQRIRLSILVLLAILFSLLSVNAQEAILNINGENISTEEFAFFMKSQRSLCYSYFYTTYNVNQSPEFWTSSYSGERPIDYIREKTLETLTEVKVHLMLAKELGMINDISFRAFLYRFDEENKRRKEITEKGGLIYGPKEFSREGYFSYWYSNLMIDLRKKWIRELEITNDSIKVYYNRMKERYRTSDEVSLILFSIPYNEPQEQEEAKKRLNLIIKNHLFNENKCLAEGILFEKLIITPNENIEAEDQILEWHRIASKLNLGESSLPIVDKRSKMVRVLYCEDYKAGYIPDLMEVENIVIQNYKEELFNHSMNQKLEEADIRFLSPNADTILLKFLK
ncbi:MAG: hypothetical protein K9H49_12470 [Bacteroidales bacterium]|nr:hypothetical protein [Bacteroidales bacterium]MCF8390611.1 hypothetical protein [Bacteroidales bacterium]